MKVFKYYFLEREKNEDGSGLPYFYRGEQIKLGDRFVLLDGFTKYHPDSYERDWQWSIKSFLEEVGDEQWFKFYFEVVYIGECECPEEFENPEEIHDFYDVDTNNACWHSPHQDTIIRKETDEPIEIDPSDFLPIEAFTDDLRFFNGVEIKPEDRIEILFGGRHEESSLIIETDFFYYEDGEIVGLNEADGYFHTFDMSNNGFFSVHEAFECKYRLVKQ